MMLLSFIVSFLLSAFLTPLIIWIYRRNNWLEDPKKHMHPKVIHTKPLPRGGGIAVFLSILFTTLLFVPIDTKILGIVIGASILVVVGFWDDLKNPSPKVRLLLQVVAALVIVLSGIAITFVTNPFGGIFHLDTWKTIIPIGDRFVQFGVLSSVLTVIWIVWCMNSVNFSTGLDGQMPGYVVVSALVIGALSTRFLADPYQLNVLLLSLIVAGSYLGLLLWNMYPQKILPGFGASTIAGFMLAVLSILSGAKLATAIIVLAIPMIDALVVVLTRLKRKQSPLSGDRSHLHHALLDLGLTKPQVALIYWGASAILGVVALSLSSEQKIFVFLLIVVSFCIIVQWLRLPTLLRKK